MGLVKWKGGKCQCEGRLWDGSSVYIVRSLKMTADLGVKREMVSQVPKSLRIKEKNDPAVTVTRT